MLAGGAVVATACSGSSSALTDNVPCGNANPDPCICGRPDADPQQAALCEEETSCEAAGGVFDPDTCGNCGDDGGVTLPHCTPGGDPGPADASRADAHD